MPLDDELSAWLRLTLNAGPNHNDRVRQLLRAFNTPEGVLAAPTQLLARHVPEAFAATLKRSVADHAVANVASWLDDSANHIITLSDAEYPQQLLQLADPPLLLYARGNVALLRRPMLAIVGSRHATPQGAANAAAFARTLSDAGLTVVSGLALGIDAAAHRGALGGASSSVAVIGTGADIVYPARNRSLAHELADKGALISEFALGTRPLAGNFPRRNRVISGLALGCLVVEAAAQSGSLITARLAAEQGREVFAIPGSIHSPLAKGCHALLKQGAKLVESAQDVLEELHWRAPAPSARPSQPSPTRNSQTQRVLEALGDDPCGRDELAVRTNLSAAELASLITELELAGEVASLPGGSIQRIRR